MHGVLQDGLVKGLQLRAISSLDVANDCALTFLAEFNARFATVPRSDFNAQQPVRGNEDLGRIFTWREGRKVPQSLTLQYDIARRSAAIEVAQYPDGRIGLWADSKPAPAIQPVDTASSPAGLTACPRPPE